MVAAPTLHRLVPAASAINLRLLDADRGALQSPIRAEVFGPQRLADHARALAAHHAAAAGGWFGPSFVPALRSNIRLLRDAHRGIEDQAAGGQDAGPAAQWLLDNFHLIDAQLKTVVEALPRRYYRSLPVLQDEPLAGLPRIYGVAWAYVIHTDSAFDEDQLLHFLNAYQGVRELQLREMWTLPTTLRVVLIENLRRLAERLAVHTAAQVVANQCLDQPGGASVPQLAAVREALRPRGAADAFLLQLASRLKPLQSGSEAARTWLDDALPQAELQQAQQIADQAADSLSVSNAVASLRAIDDTEWPDLVANASPLMRRMMDDPLFAAEDAGTRDQTLHRIEALARHSGRSEGEVGEALLGLVLTARQAHARPARQAEPPTPPDLPHPATAADTAAGRLHGIEPGASPGDLAHHWLQGAGRPALWRALDVGPAPLGERLGDARVRHRAVTLPLYLLTLAGLCGATVAALTAGSAWPVLAAALLLLPVSEAVIAVMNRLISETLPPVRLPRLALRAGLGAEHRTMVVVPCLLSSANGTRALLHRLLLHHLANPEPVTQFALLSDWVDAPGRRADGDDALLLDAALQVRELNAAHPQEVGSDAAGRAAPRFVLLHRPRRHSATEAAWIGWERKRGKLEQLVASLADGQRGEFIDLGDTSRMATGTRHLITLDSDTELPPGGLHALVAVAAHPANRPQLDRAARRVQSGHGVLQPRLDTPLPTPASLTPFHWLFAGECGLDPYSAAMSEVHQDLYGEGSFSGKGLIDVQAMHRVLGGRLPEDQVLSHDLLEGALLRCATVSDLALVEDAPFHADVAASRRHRWTRGDWQLLPFIARWRRWPVGAVNRWKMVDNLRRSLVTPASLALVVAALAGAVIAPGTAVWVVLAAYAGGPLIGALAGLVPPRWDVSPVLFLRRSGEDLLRAAAGGVWHLALLVQGAQQAADAIARAVWRLAVSRRHLLQWTTAAAAQAAAQHRLGALWRSHAAEPLGALALLGVLWFSGTPHLLAAVALCALWAASPLWTWAASRALPRRPAAALSAAQTAQLHALARDTWRLFERCVGPDDRHLPPDNLQVDPQDMLAHRSSPTNIGLYLLSTACARSFGWIDTTELLDRLEATHATLQTLQRHRGHFLNWYDTQTGAALLPMYVSTVDSGNLSGHLLAVAQACRELARMAPDPTLGPTASEKVSEPPSADQLARLRTLAQAFEALAWAPDFRFLYHRKRRLLHIGYRLAEQQLDRGFYDLLASESRLTSLIAIAKGDLPVAHWAALGRPFYAVGGHAGLRSWSGSMFEYLMPGLVLVEPAGSALNEACQTAIREQIHHGLAEGLPWGQSESAHAGRDHTLAYQYAPHGVPRLALRRTPPGEAVVAPYATVMALPWQPAAAVRNLAWLERLGARGDLGFCEALDCAADRRLPGGQGTLVRTYMAHHQGMSIVALANLLLGGPAQRWGMAEPRMQAMTTLLHERSPRALSRLATPHVPARPQTGPRSDGAAVREVAPGALAVEPTHLMSNGRCAVSLRPNGAGTSRWGPVGLTRQRDDALRDAHGHFFWLRWATRPQAVSLTQHPAPDPAADYRCRFDADRVVFDTRWPGLQARATVWVSPEDDVEFREIELWNTGDRPLDLALSSAFEPTLCEPAADEAHPAFTNLFVTAQWRAAQRALVLTRTPRLASETGLHLAHFLADCEAELLGVTLQTDRQRWLGRGRDASQPQCLTEAPPPGVLDEALGEPAPVALDTGLDPMCAMTWRLRVAPQGRARLCFATATAVQAATLAAVIDKYRQAHHVKRASLMSATLCDAQLHSQRLGADTRLAAQGLNTALLLTLAHPGVVRSSTASAIDRRLLWRHGLSGDRPLLLVSAGVAQGAALLRTLAQLLRLWAHAQVACDLVIVNSEPVSYDRPLHRALAGLRDQHLAAQADSPRPCTALVLLDDRALSDAERATLGALARLHLHADGRPLQLQVDAWLRAHELDRELRQGVSTSALGLAPVPATAGAAPQGRFSATGERFIFDVSASRRPTRPWVNVLANPGFGAIVSDTGAGGSWALNSRLNQLTAWSNDPVADPPSEHFWLQDRTTRRVWSATPSATGAAGAGHRVVHGQGSTVISHRVGELSVVVTWVVDPVQAVKHVTLRLVNHGALPLRLRVVAVAEWLMGAQRTDRASVHTSAWRQRHGDLIAVLATQRDAAGGFGQGTAFLGTRGDVGHSVDWTADRRELFDARGRAVLPDHLGRLLGAGLDPCAALALDLDIAPGDAVEPVFVLGHAASLDAARGLLAEALALPARQRLAASQAHWQALLGATTVHTPDPLFDAMVNRWLLYQVLSSRLWAKAGFYQAGGASGFRDQLQDAMALAWAAPALLRAQILACAARQYPEGDVQHWWHSPSGAGVRTHFSDDLLWLPLACARHVQCTGDTGVLAELRPFLDGPPVPAGAEDRYDTPGVTSDQASVYEHAARCIDRSLRTGAHGLPLMGTGDWNDGMNRVGHGGQGESVWLGWFLCHVVAEFMPLAAAQGDMDRVARWRAAADGWAAALQDQAWDGQWYLRAWFDNGQPLGTQADTEARIDLIAQAWAVLSGVAPLARAERALDAADAELADPTAGVLRLLHPPLAHHLPSAGYIQAYPPGVRENGGQYNHAAVWALMAQAALARRQWPTGGVEPMPRGGAVQDERAERHDRHAERVWRDFRWISPAHRAQDPVHGAVYGLEPYAVAGDVYSHAPWAGRGGWSWYTGAAGWLHRAAVESLFGLDVQAERLRLIPCLPPGWDRAELRLNRPDCQVRFILLRQTPGDAMPRALRDEPGLQAVRLLPGDWVAWRGLAPDTCFVVPLLRGTPTGVMTGPTDAGDGVSVGALAATAGQRSPHHRAILPHAAADGP